jgi:hypothetical protein
MASNVHHSLADQGALNNSHGVFDNDMNNPSFFSEGFDQNTDSPWSYDPAQQLGHHAVHQHPSVSQTWHQSQSVNLQPNPHYDLHHQYYGRQYSHSPAPFHNPASTSEAHRFAHHAVDPALLPPSRTSHVSTYASSSTPSYPGTTETITPSALQPSYEISGHSVKSSAYPGQPSANNAIPTPTVAVQPPSTNQPRTLPASTYTSSVGQNAGSAPSYSQTSFLKAPASTPDGVFSIIDFEELSKATSSRRLDNFVNISDTPVDLALNRSMFVRLYLHGNL